MPLSQGLLVPGLLPRANFVPLILFVGESNATGLAPNADLTVAQKAPRTSVKILNNTTLAFETLQVGVNNTIDSATFTNNAQHGWEVGLADAVEGGMFAPFSQVYLIKAGQGGATISSWAMGGTFWTKFATRYAAAVASLSAQGLRPMPVVWYSQGINDRGNDQVWWRGQTLAFFAQLRSLVGYCPVLMTQFAANIPGFTTQIDLITGGVGKAGSGLDAFSASIAPATTYVDGNPGAHWDTLGMATIAAAMANQTVAMVGVSASEYADARLAALTRQQQLAATPVPNPSFSVAGGSYASTQTIAVTCPLSAALIYTTLDNTSPSTASTPYTGPITIAGNKTLKAIAVVPNMAPSDIAGASYVIATQSSVSPIWGSLQNATSTAANLQHTGAIPAGAVATQPIDATSPFRVSMPLQSSALADGVILFLDSDTSASYTFAGTTKKETIAQIHVDTGLSYADRNLSLDVSAGSSWVGPTFVYGATTLMSLVKNGDDVLAQLSANAGTTWTTIHTFPAALKGRASVILKVLFAPVGSQQAIVTIQAG